ncbi:MAG: hypothetical protein LBG20_00755 [Holosporaceae bacterium]|jgi:hypothetical protein|nr:hypothetical protein [Holosporaceae bacterium]
MAPKGNTLIMRICHDLITPFNAINLGIEAFKMSGDSILLNEIKASVDKANSILKFIRELYSVKPNSFCHPISSLSHLVADFLEKHGIFFSLNSDLENIPHSAARIVMYNAIIAKEAMPFGGEVSVSINDNAGEIVTICSGKNMTVPNLNMEGNENHKNVMRISLLRLLDELKFRTIVYQEEAKLIIHEQMI